MSHHAIYSTIQSGHELSQVTIYEPGVEGQERFHNKAWIESLALKIAGDVCMHCMGMYLGHIRTSSETFENSNLNPCKMV